MRVGEIRNICFKTVSAKQTCSCQLYFQFPSYRHMTVLVFQYLFQNKMFVLFKVWDFSLDHLLFAVMRRLTRNFNVPQPLPSQAFEI